MIRGLKSQPKVAARGVPTPWLAGSALGLCVSVNPFCGAGSSSALPAGLEWAGNHQDGHTTCQGKSRPLRGWHRKAGLWADPSSLGPFSAKAQAWKTEN